MADTTHLEPDTLAEDDSGASGRDASKAERKTRSAPATKPRRRSPAKPSESRAKGSAKSGDKPSSGRFEHADGQAGKNSGPAAATDPTAATAVVDASILLDRVAELTSVAERQRVRLEEDEAERNRLQSELQNERQRRETAERRVVDLEDRYNEVAAELASEREAREQAELDLARADENAALLEQQVRLGWGQVRAFEEAQESKRRWWRPGA